MITLYFVPYKSYTYGFALDPNLIHTFKKYPPQIQSKSAPALKNPKALTH